MKIKREETGESRGLFPFSRPANFSLSRLPHYLRAWNRLGFSSNSFYVVLLLVIAITEAVSPLYFRIDLT